ncbi:hypothetical protein [Mesorhizobium sp.]|uniref:hypothetical protein n=1 Tax=Mesorhizobium sp. TaxID=1871066 RepID=UPI00120257C3|nr:hypothetical protein [Mesorhizobium sp.]TIL43488.1 MAG: hypothetical protein E5Y86_21695 [Mesorhizobium sp.]
MDKTPFGNTQDGKAVDLYTLTNDGGASIKFIAYGGIITAINVPTAGAGSTTSCSASRNSPTTNP